MDPVHMFNTLTKVFAEGKSSGDKRTAARMSRKAYSYKEWWQGKCNKKRE